LRLDAPLDDSLDDGLEARAVFTFDFWHPAVTPAERVALSMLLVSRS